MKYNFGNRNNSNSDNHLITKSRFENSTWIAFDLEWQSISCNKKDTFSNKYANNHLTEIASGDSVPPASNFNNNNITTFGFEDSNGNSGCFDITDFNSPKSFLLAIKEKLLQYNYCFAWGSKSIIRKNNESGKLEGINGDLVTLDLNFKNNGISSIIKYNKFSLIPYIKNVDLKKKQIFISDIDLLLVFAKPIVRNMLFKNKYKSLHLDEVSKALLGYGKLDNKSGSKIDEMSFSGRKSYCLHDAHLVAELIRINHGETLKMMDIISCHTKLKFEQICHKGMTGIWKKILDEIINKKISTIGYGNLSPTLRKLHFI
jgi:hypothetical protein